MLLFKTESIWVAWIHQNVIKNMDIWLLKEQQSHTWIFKNILRLRDLVVNWIRIIPGNGSRCKFWTSPWSPFGQLISYLGNSGPRTTGIPITATLASLWINNSWALPSARSNKMEEVLTHLTTISLSPCPDIAIWDTSGSGQNQKFSSGQIYNLIREQKPEVPWKNLVWQKKGIPKFKTLTWLFILDRCPTRNRLISWGLQSDPTCLLCNREPESRDHLFFCCDYSFSVWGTLARNLNLLLPSNSWNDTLEALINLNGDRHLRFLITLAWQASIYELWRERNNMLHRKVYRSSSAILSSIKAVIKNRISSFRDINGDFSSTTMQLWFASV